MKSVKMAIFPFVDEKNQIISSLEGANNFFKI